MIGTKLMWDSQPRVEEWSPQLPFDELLYNLESKPPPESKPPSKVSPPL